MVLTTMACRCHTSYVTNYDSQQEEECEENFKKVCHINYEPLAYNETVQICRTPIVKVCSRVSLRLDWCPGL